MKSITLNNLGVPTTVTSVTVNNLLTNSKWDCFAFRKTNRAIANIIAFFLNKVVARRVLEECISILKKKFSDKGAYKKTYANKQNHGPNRYVNLTYKRSKRYVLGGIQ